MRINGEHHTIGRIVGYFGILFLGLMLPMFMCSEADAFPMQNYEIGGTITIDGDTLSGPDNSVVVRIEAGNFTAVCSPGECKPDTPNIYYFVVLVDSENVAGRASPGDIVRIYINDREVEQTKSGQVIVTAGETEVLPVVLMEPTLIEIPDIMGVNPYQAIYTILNPVGLFNIGMSFPSECSDDVSAGNAIRTYPAAGELVAADTLITIYISNGETCPPPDTDGDGVPDDEDVCPGYDDTVDTDGDTIPDGCDSWSRMMRITMQTETESAGM